MSKTFLVENAKGEQHVIAGDPFPKLDASLVDCLDAMAWLAYP